MRYQEDCLALYDIRELLSTVLYLCSMRENFSCLFGGLMAVELPCIVIDDGNSKVIVINYEIVVKS